MKIQTERLDNHTARLTVEVEPERFALAKQKAARAIAQKVNLPGFRKGKAPYNIIVRYVGEPAILEDAVEIVSSDVYPAALQEAGVEPYGPGSVEDFSHEEPISIIFVVPLQPTVDLKDYRSIHLPYEEPVVTDREVEAAIKELLHREAVVEESDAPAAMGDQVTLDIHSHIEAGEEEGAENTDFIHEHKLEFVLDADNDLLPGFSEKLVGVLADSEFEFDLDVPEDSEDYPEQRGKTAHFELVIGAVNHITLPALNDEFAARVTEDEDEPLTLLQLRLRLREQLAESAQERSYDAYASRVLDLILEQADIRYPEAAVTDEVASMLESMDQQLRRQGMNLQDYKRLVNQTDEDLFNAYRDVAISRIRHAMVRGEVFGAEQLEVTEEQLDAELNRIMGRVEGEDAALVREMLGNQGMDKIILNRLAERNVRDRLVAIGRNEAPDLPAPPAIAEAEALAEPESETETAPETTPETTDDSEETA